MFETTPVERSFDLLDRIDWGISSIISVFLLLLGMIVVVFFDRGSFDD
jgi:hypothetical protein